jgi:hypothetical protein
MWGCSMDEYRKLSPMSDDRVFIDTNNNVLAVRIEPHIGLWHDHFRNLGDYTYEFMPGKDKTVHPDIHLFDSEEETVLFLVFHADIDGAFAWRFDIVPDWRRESDVLLFSDITTCFDTYTPISLAKFVTRSPYIKTKENPRYVPEAEL